MEKIRRILFLDFDGVITTLKSKYTFDKECCNLIQEIVDKTSCEIVITSSWRQSDLQRTKDYLRTLYENETDDRLTFWPKWIDNLTGVTKRLYMQDSSISVPRGVEIREFLHSQYKQGVDIAYCILDDDSDMLLEQAENFVKTDTYKGILKKQVKKVIAILLSTNYY